MTALLEARGLTVNYGGVNANDHIDVVVPEGSLVGLIGANGAGKTTFVDAITGFAPVSSGSVWFHGENVTRAIPERRARKGMLRTFQTLELFDDLTVRDNLRVASDRTHWWSFLSDLLRRSKTARTEENVQRALRTLRIEHLADRLPRELSHGQRKMAGIARALAASPRLLLLDEPAAGLDAHESMELSTMLRDLRDEGITMFLIDHDMGLMLSVCDDVYVLDFGRIIAHGTPSVIRSDRAVIAAYLGTGGTPADSSPTQTQAGAAVANPSEGQT
jgi:branched-chain amino acid transport system ATP-binding protein